MHSRTLSLANFQQFQREHLTSLLPQGPRTSLRVDVYQLLARSTKRWKLLIPSTLHSNSHVVSLLKTNQRGKVCVKRSSSTIREFLLSVIEVAAGCHFPKLVHKSQSSQAAFIYDLPAAESAWREHASEDQKLQTFIAPPHATVSLIRTHWKHSAKRSVYYIVHNAGHKRQLKTCKDSLPGVNQKKYFHLRHKSLAEKYQTDETDVPFLVNETAANAVFVKRTNPDPAIDCMMQEVADLIQTTLYHENVEELVCDFVLDGKNRAVLLSCQGFSFSTKKVQLTQTMSVSVMEHDTAVEDSVADSEQCSPAKVSLRPSSVVSPKYVSRPLLPLLHRPLFLKPDFKFTQTRLANVATAYDAIVSKVKMYKEELKKSINYVEKYGGVDFWKPILHKIGEVFRADDRLKLYYEHLNYEESYMLLRGYQRIIEGNYNLYYKKSMGKVHDGKGIDSKVFQCFVSNVEIALDGYPIAPEDIVTIVSRFRSFESCICRK